MTNEDKNLLLKDICARLPYNIIIHDIRLRYDWCLREIYVSAKNSTSVNFSYEDVENFQPYLRPMSSMTEKESQEYYELTYIEEKRYILPSLLVEITDWLNAHHFDYRGLIERGLALKAKEGMYD